MVRAVRRRNQFDCGGGSPALSVCRGVLPKWNRRQPLFPMKFRKVNGWPKRSGSIERDFLPSLSSQLPLRSVRE